jgi:hypothetical protein
MTNVVRSLLAATALIGFGTAGASATPLGEVSVADRANDLVQDVRLVCDPVGRCFYRRGYYGGPVYPYVRPYYGYDRGYYGYGPGYGYGGPGIGFGFGIGPGWY